MLERFRRRARLSIVDLLRSDSPLPIVMNRPRLTLARRIWYPRARVKH
jgi:hypothetical protein